MSVASWWTLSFSAYSVVGSVHATPELSGTRMGALERAVLNGMWPSNLLTSHQPTFLRYMTGLMKFDTRAAAGDRSMCLPRTQGPLSFIRTTIQPS